VGLYVEVQYTGDWWGEDPLTETAFDKPGDLFRALAGKDHSRPWMALGRCTGKVYIDVPGSACGLCGKPRSEHEHNPSTNPITTRWIEPCPEHPHGAITTDGQHYYQADAQQVGWIFEARNPEPVRRGDPKETGLRIAWVTVHDAPPTVTRTPHYANLGGGPR
jgi:hypothetical protein